MRALLDVNVLIALIDEKHDFHERAHVWWQARSGDGRASCPLTENGFVRIVSQLSQRLEPVVPRASWPNNWPSSGVRPTINSGRTTSALPTRRSFGSTGFAAPNR